jgi:hypothetical protein
MGSRQKKCQCQQNFVDESDTGSLSSQPKMIKQHQQQLSHENFEATSGTMDLENSPSPPSVNGKSKTNVIVSHLRNFLQQQSDHAWLFAPHKKTVGSHYFHNSVLFSTFPASLNQSDFEYYIDTTFSNYPEPIVIRMKALFNKNDPSSLSKDFAFNVHDDGTQSATLIQILTEKNEYNELEMVVGVISVIQKPSMDYHYVEDNWRNQERVQRALQYIFGMEAQKRISP